MKSYIFCRYRYLSLDKTVRPWEKIQMRSNDACCYRYLSFLYVLQSPYPENMIPNPFVFSLINHDV